MYVNLKLWPIDMNLAVNHILDCLNDSWRLAVEREVQIAGHNSTVLPSEQDPEYYIWYIM
jgi:hypothetical protein